MKKNNLFASMAGKALALAAAVMLSITFTACSGNNQPPRPQIETTYDVALEKVGEKETQVIEALSEITGLDLKVCKTLVDNTPCIVLKDAQKPKAEAAAELLNNAGAVANVYPHDTYKPVHKPKDCVTIDGEERTVLSVEYEEGSSPSGEFFDLYLLLSEDKKDYVYIKGYFDAHLDKEIDLKKEDSETPWKIIYKERDKSLFESNAASSSEGGLLFTTGTLRIDGNPKDGEITVSLEDGKITDSEKDEEKEHTISISWKGTPENLNVPQPGTTYDVALEKVGESETQVIETLSEITGLGLRESKELVDNTPCIVLKDVQKSKAEAAAERLKNAGAVANVYPHNTYKPTPKPEITYDVALEKVGESKIQVIKAVKEITGLGLRESKELVDNTPCIVLKDVQKSKAEAAAERLKNAGAVANAYPHNTYKPTPKPETTYDVALEKVGESKIQVIKAVKEITGLGLRESKELVDNTPCIVLKDVQKSKAEAAAERLKNAGAVANVYPHNTYKPTPKPEITYDVALEKVGESKIQVIKAVKEITGLGLKESKELVENAPCIILKDVQKSKAEAAAERLKNAGAVANAYPHNTYKPTPKPETTYDVALEEIGESKIQVIKAVKEITGLGLVASKELVDNAPCIILKDVQKSKAEAAAERLKNAGAVANVYPHNTYKPGKK